MADIPSTDAVDAQALSGFDAIIDVRSPGEFAEDHVPGAISLPVLSDAERAEVGTIYVQESRYTARRIGAAHVARNIAHHLETALADKPGTFAPLVYCWRGGQRSNAMATVLTQVGWRTTVLAGGYRTYRRNVKSSLYDDERNLKVILLDGHTGTAKTDILGLLAARGAQTLDLEGLAEHRGSLFGGIPGRPQPSQKMFESRLLAALDRLDPALPVIVEAESSKIGDRMVPPVLWRAMLAAPRIELHAPLSERIGYLTRAYADIARDRDVLDDALQRLPVHPGRKRLEDWRRMADAGALDELAAALIELHYDPAYDRSSRKDGRRRLGTIEVETLGPSGQAAAAEAVLGLVATAFAA